jgi:peptidoglycan/xylan/chitin deacetylase (PgdA/CDA1 family)
MHVCLPWFVLTNTGLVESLDERGQVTLTADLSRPAPHHGDTLRLRRAFTDHGPASSRLPFSYHRVPAWLRHGIAFLVGRRQKKRPDIWAAFPRWPLDLSADFLADWAAGPSPSLAAHGPTPVLLTHDLDSPEGVTNLVDLFLEREERHGARSTSFVVPCGWPLDQGLLRAIRQRGHTLGVHGYDHANRTAFVAAAERRRRLSAGKEILSDYGVEGYRAPSLLRTRALLQDLECLYRFDSSIPTSGGLFPTPNNGCASARPFLVDGLAEIPLSMPRDGSLRFFGHGPDEIRDLWIACARTIARSRGVVVLLTHCEKRFSGNPGMLQAYEDFMDFISCSAEFCWSSFTQFMDTRRHPGLEITRKSA